MDVNQFQEKNELLSFIKSASRDCVIYICNVLLRGDVAVSSINCSSQRVADHWNMHAVKRIEDTHDLLFGRNELPAVRNNASDGIRNPSITFWDKEITRWYK